jgi:DNA-binding protein Fis
MEEVRYLAGRVAPTGAPVLRRVMNWVEGNRTKAAGILGIGRKTLYRKLKEFDGISGE